MALSKNMISDEGITTAYHKISDVSLHEDILRCTISSYVSKEYRDLERPADYRIFRFNITVEEEEAMGIRQLAYKKIKETNDWADAVDC